MSLLQKFFSWAGESARNLIAIITLATILGAFLGNVASYAWSSAFGDFLKDGDVIVLRINYGGDGDPAPDQQGILSASSRDYRPHDGGNASLTTTNQFNWIVEKAR